MSMLFEDFVPPERDNICFSSGKLYIFLKKRSITVIQPTPPYAWQRRSGTSSQWHFHEPAFRTEGSCLIPVPVPTHYSMLLIEDEPEGQLLLPLSYSNWYRKNIAISLFNSAIPRTVRHAAIHYRDIWKLLCFFLRVKHGLTLFKSNPTLAFLLAQISAFSRYRAKDTMEVARRLILKKQAEILEVAGFPPTNAVRHMLGRTDTRALSISRLLKLRGSLMEDYDAVMKVLSMGQKMVNADLLRIASEKDLRYSVAPSFLHECAMTSNTDPIYATLLLEVLTFRKILGMSDQRLYSLRGLTESFNALSRMVARVEYGNILQLELPEPPIPGDLEKGIEPLRTMDSIVSWGYKTCLREEPYRLKSAMYGDASYVARILRNNGSYLYKVSIGRSKGTLFIQKNLNGIYQVSEFRGMDNRNIPRDSRMWKIVSDWLEGHNQ